jgi:hypothetical protein
VFVSYSHDDEQAVLGEIAWLQSRGIRVWYDAGIATGSRWSEQLATHLLGADRVVYFVSPSSARSENCLDEVNYALDNQKTVIAVHLSATELPPGAALRLAHRQAILSYDLEQKVYRERLLDALQVGDQMPGVESPPSRSNRSGFVVAIAFVISALAVWWFFSPRMTM